ncbi:hypothetical protein [Sphingomonas japonica]|uniref:Peptidoglycan/LPS O-acetylase OafA/YrhL n=1 Tax=Sphingomonas japonica TaxID=511662 RepID=A0ABX0U1F1_9SPHN|nr:hypothetical protein [Sphingomonas japonica]NIJ23526.1 peptidoglycan/LPS O-acetylase OafA/YrhL [Sphingomonas japonica]
MASGISNNRGRQPGILWRIVGWGFAAALLALPLVARWPWTAPDFAFAAVMIGGVGMLFEIAVRFTTNLAYRAGVAAALVAGFLLVWINAAVGIIGDEGNPANLMYAGVVGIALIGAMAARGRPGGMVRAMASAAIAVALIAAITLRAGLGGTEPPGALGVLVLNGFFVALLSGSAALFRAAARSA